ncbi:MAG: putative porin [Bacteroidota bacterium]
MQQNSILVETNKVLSKHQHILFFLLLGICSFWQIDAQRPGAFPRGGGFNTSGSGAPRGGQEESNFQETVDTFGVFYFYANQPNGIKQLDDTTIYQFDIYDPANQESVRYANLGNFGSSHRPFYYATPFRQGFDVGYHQFDLYYIQPENVQFNILEKPFTRIFYSRGATQSDGYFKGQFSRNFADGLSFTIEGKTIRQLGESRQFPNQRVEDEAVGTGLWWNAPNEKYDAFLYFTSNSTEQEENGGIETPPIEGDALVVGGSNSQTADVFLPNGTQTRHSHRTAGFKHYLKFTKQDTAKNASREFTAFHKIQFQSSNFKFSDELRDTAGRRDYYGEQLYVDRRGLRNFIRWQVLENTVQLGTFRLKGKSNAGVPKAAVDIPLDTAMIAPIRKELSPVDTLNQDSSSLYNPRGARERSTTNAKTTALSKEELNRIVNQSIKESDRIEVGLTHKLNFLQQDLQDSIINNLFVTGRLDFRLKDRVQVKTYVHLGLLANAGDYRLSGDLFFDIGKIGKLSAQFVNQAYEPYLIQQELYVSQRPVWQQDLRKTISTSLTGSYHLPAARLRVRGGYHLVNNFVYYDTLAIPQQAENALNILQLAANHHLKLWKIHFENQIVLQATTQDFYRTPAWLSSHRLYLDATLFKKTLNFQLGGELHMNEPYSAEGYQPLVGAFHLSPNREEVNFYPALDLFFNAKIRTMRFFVKAENVTDFLTQNYFYYQTANYAQPLFLLRFGFDWRFVN